MESKIKLKVVKSERLSAKKHEDRYVIIDEITGMAVDNAGGHGYKSAEGALAHYRYKWKCGNTLKVRPTVNTWFIEHKDFFDDINEALSCLKRNRISVDKKELMSEMLKSHGLEVEYNMNTMVRVWESITSTF